MLDGIDMLLEGMGMDETDTLLDVCELFIDTLYTDTGMASLCDGISGLDSECFGEALSSTPTDCSILSDILKKKKRIILTLTSITIHFRFS